MTAFLLEAPVRASLGASRARDAVARRVSSSDNPVLVIVLAAAIVIGLGFIAYLTAICIGNGYRGFGGVVNINWNNPLSATVRFACIR
jgi:hypothetical protein